LQGGEGIPKLHWSGTEGNFNIIVMDLLGKSMEELYHLCKKKLSIQTILVLAEQMVRHITTHR